MLTVASRGLLPAIGLVGLCAALLTSADFTHYLLCLHLQGPKKKLSNKEKKQRAKVRKARRERGEEVSDTDEDDL